MKDNFIQFSYRIIFLLSVTVAVAMPLFFLPVTSEFFETNKFNFFLVATILSLIIWGLRMVLQKKFSFTRTPLNIPIIILAAVFFIASLASLDQFISLVGTVGKPWPSFFSVITLAGFYFVTSANLRTRKQAEILLLALTASTTLAAIVAIISYFGFYFPFDFAAFRSFNTLGSTNTLALIEAVSITVCLSWVLFTRSQMLRGLGSAFAAIQILSLVLLNFPAAYLGLTVGLVFIVSLVFKSKVSRPSQIAAGVLILIAFLLFTIRFVPKIADSTLGQLIIAKPAKGQTLDLDTAKNIVLPQVTGWDIATSTLGKRPLFGTGPSTYQFAYTQLKPRTVNSTPNWAIRFDKSSSDFLEIVTTLGIAGVLAILILIATVVRFIWYIIFKNNTSTGYFPAAAGTITFLALMFFATTSFSIVAIFFVIISSLIVLAKTQDEKHVEEITVEVATLRNSLNWLPGGKLGVIKATSAKKGTAKSQILPALFLIFVLVASYLALSYQIKAVRAEYYYRQAILTSIQNNGTKTIDNLQAAINLNPNVDLYHKVLSTTTLNAAVTLFNSGKLNNDQQNLLTQLATVAIEQGKVASGYQILPLRLPGISSANAGNWEAVAAAYKAVIGSVQGADVNAINTLAQAIALDPENPVLHEQLGRLYLKLKNVDSAQRKFEDATVIKNDYGPAHYDLAKLLIDKNGDVVRIAQELVAAKKFLPANDQAIGDINAKLVEFNQKVEDLQKAQNQAATQANENPNASPSPSPSPTPSPTQKPSL